MVERTESSIVVEAAPADVLAVIADFAAYPQWTGAVRQAEVLALGDDGLPARVRFVLDAGAIKDTYTLDYVWQADGSGISTVNWALSQAEQLLTVLDGSYRLVGDPAGTTTVTYRLAVDVRIPMLGMLKRKAEKSIIGTALKELKKRTEG
jgi:ribosome-associated toxin RatA of RatAB toxin-antitoxin module